MNGKGNKMIKRLATLFVSLLLIFESLPAMAVGEYYFYRDLPKITQEDLLYKGADLSELKTNISSIESLLRKKGNEEEIILLCEKCFEVYTDVSYQYVLAKLAYDRNQNDENLENLNEITDVSLDIADILSGLIYDIYESEEYYYLLELLFGDTETALEFALPDDEEIIGLLDREAELKTQYSEIYGDSDACAELFVELIKVRNQIAVKMGYDNYAEYAKKELFGREYTDAEIAEFYSAVKEYFVPLYEKAGVGLLLSKETGKSMTEDDVLLTARSAVKRINPELADSYEYMIANNIYDIRPNENKNPGAGSYTVIIPRLNVPYIYINPIYGYDIVGVYGVTTLIHEFGHFASMLNTPEMEFSDASAFLSPSIDTAEIHSQGLEVLSERYYGRMFGADASAMRYNLLFNLVCAVIDGCLVDQWQEQVYAMDEPTVEKLNVALVDIIAEYYGECAPENAQNIWTGLHHNYNTPMYYLSYALSASIALGLYSDSLENYDGAVDKYMCISSEGVYRTFAEITDMCGLYNIYDKSVMKEISEKTADAFALGYSDIPESAWYMEYLYAVSNIMDGRTDNEFMPDAKITRSEFVTTLGRMYDYYVGIDKEYECNFADVTDDEIKQYIGWAQTEGIIDGYDDVTFGVDDALTREQAATILFRLADVASDNTNVSVFVDADAISEWARPATSWAVKEDIINGRDGDVFDPKTSITRAETAKIVSMYIISEY